MNKIDQLFIRACKSPDPIPRLNRTYRRFYLGRDEGNPTPYQVVAILTRIIDNQNLKFSLQTIMTELSSRNDWKYTYTDCPPGTDTFDYRCLQVLISRIRLTKRTDYTGLSIPQRFR
jgi:hypothetical protein